MATFVGSHHIARNETGHERFPEGIFQLAAFHTKPHGSLSMISTFAVWIAILLFAGGMVYAGLKDMATMTIPNRLVLWLAGAYLILAPTAGIGLDEISASALAAAAVLACTFALFAFGWIGGGDAKFSAVAVLWLGSDLTLDYAVYTSVCGAFLTLALLQFRRFPLPAILQESGWPRRLHEPGSGVPYGVALATAGLLLLPGSPWIAAVL
jgi:prepilin peptidase CpaA